MNIFNSFREYLISEIQEMVAADQLPADLDTSRITMELPRDASHGDLATNAAMLLAKGAGRKPRELAEDIAERLKKAPGVASVEIAGPGFINLRLTDSFWQSQIPVILEAGLDYGRSELGNGLKVNVEYVSANPTGPLTIGHARGAVVGDVLAGLLEKAGYDVTREYYVNDAGNQVDTLARSAYLRYREAHGEDIGEIPPGMYPGDYLRDVGAALKARDGDRWLDADEEVWLPEVRAFAIDSLTQEIKRDLAFCGVEQAVFSSERRLVDSGAVDEVVETLKARELLYTGVLEPPKGKTPEDWEPRPQLLFKATEFGDDIDRPIAKSDGSWTYFANDMAYHLDKFRRGFPVMIDVWGADHGGYVKRMKAAVKALTEEKGRLDILLCQLVKLSRGGDPVKMSKRAGTFVTLRDVVEEVGKDVLRFIMLTRKSDAPLEFDLEAVLEESKDNPVFYVQYAHARCCSVLRHARDAFPDLGQEADVLAGAPVALLTDSGEIGLIKHLCAWPRTVELAAEAYEPHRVAFFLTDLAATFHGLWNRGKEDATLRFLLEDDPQRTAARLALLKATAMVLASGLFVMGVEPREELR